MFECVCVCVWVKRECNGHGNDSLEYLLKYIIFEEALMDLKWSSQNLVYVDFQFYRFMAGRVYLYSTLQQGNAKRFYIKHEKHDNIYFAICNMLANYESILYAYIKMYKWCFLNKRNISLGGALKLLLHQLIGISHCTSLAHQWPFAINIKSFDTSVSDWTKVVRHLLINGRNLLGHIRFCTSLPPSSPLLHFQVNIVEHSKNI